MVKMTPKQRVREQHARVQVNRRFSSRVLLFPKLHSERNLKWDVMRKPRRRGVSERNGQLQANSQAIMMYRNMYLVKYETREVELRFTYETSASLPGNRNGYDAGG